MTAAPVIRGPGDIPGYAAAVAQESLARTVAFHGVTVRVCGFPLLPLTLRHYSALRLARSPFIPPFTTPEPADVVLFLWALSPAFTTGDSAAKRRHLRRCRAFLPPRRPWLSTRRAMDRWAKRSAAALMLRAEIVKRCRDFMDEAMQDRPARPTSTMDGIPEPDHYADEASLVDAIAREYGWTEAEILNLPLARAFQYLKAIREHICLTNGRPPLLCNRSDEIVDRYLLEVNMKGRN